VDGRLAGFALLRRGTCFPERDVLGDDSGMMITEFFVMRKYRRQGIGKQVAPELFEHYPGRWEVAELPQNAARLAFWRKTIGEYTRGITKMSCWMMNAGTHRCKYLTIIKY
jgi:predicted acetyltransferase